MKANGATECERAVSNTNESSAAEHHLCKVQRSSVHEYAQAVGRQSRPSLSIVYNEPSPNVTVLGLASLEVTPAESPPRPVTLC